MHTSDKQGQNAKAHELRRLQKGNRDKLATAADWRLFSSNAGQDTSEFTLVDSLPSAQKAAWSDTYGIDEFNWTDIREKEAAIVRGAVYSLSFQREFGDYLSGELRTLLPLLKLSLSAEYADLLDDAYADLINIVRNRAMNAPSSFFHALENAYAKGGWPCGWAGDYPEGRLLVFMPSQKM